MHKLLKHDGSVEDIASDWLAASTVIHTGTLPTTPHRDIFDQWGTDTVVVVFDSTSDGRGYSLAAEIRECHGHDRVVYASGALIPDQVSLAFQCGFSGVIVTPQQIDQYGEENWRVAQTPMIDNGYATNNWCGIGSIWAQRRMLRAGRH